jgi:hypothetical protein
MSGACIAHRRDEKYISYCDQKCQTGGGKVRELGMVVIIWIGYGICTEFKETQERAVLLAVVNTVIKPLIP